MAVKHLIFCTPRGVLTFQGPIKSTCTLYDAVASATFTGILQYYCLDKASAIKLCLPYICLNSGPNSSLSKHQRINLSEVLFAYVNFV
jgi:hypothetical protein